MSGSSSALCDTIPAARLATSTTAPETTPLNDDDIAFDLAVEEDTPKPTQTTTSGPPPRKLCVRHQRMADEGTNLKLQQSLEALPLSDREAINNIWSNFSSSSHPRRALILHGLLTMCCFSQLSLLTEQLAHLIRIDPFTVLPREICLQILKHLDATSLCRAAQVTKRWRSLADDDHLWKGICQQHIGQKCHKCGWGLPVLEKMKSYRLNGVSSCPPSPEPKRRLEDHDDRASPPSKRPRLLPLDSDSSSASAEASDCNSLGCALLASEPQPPRDTRPWKAVYSERLAIERNWRRGRCTVRTIKGHTDGVMCLQFKEDLSHPQFPVLITGSYDRTVRVWNMETGVELHCLKGHSRVIRALQFDEVKLITASMDCTLKVWDWRRGRCIRTLIGHSEGVVSLNYDSNVLASGSVDATIKVWNLRTGGAFTLRGHSDWVNSVVLWDSMATQPTSASATTPVFDSPQDAPQIDPGKMLFSASDDGTIRLWDLTLRTCIRQFTGHVQQVQSIKLLPSDDCDEPIESDSDTASDASKTKYPVLISGSLDNTIKMWDIETGDTLQTFFGHIEGVWAIAADKMRLVSASHDRTIKVWSRENGHCEYTHAGHRGAVSCIALGEDKIVSGGDDSEIRIWSFSG